MILRFTALFCFVGAGLSAIYLSSHIGSQALVSSRIQDLVSYFFTALGIFVFFYGQYRLVQRFSRRRLYDPLGYLQSAGGLALLLIGLLKDLSANEIGTEPSRLLWFIAGAGEFVFLLNVFWSYVSGDVPVLSKAPERTALKRDTDFGWPKSPVKLFGIAAVVFGAIGIVSIALNLPSLKVPVPWGNHAQFIPFGSLWLGAAAPFAIFALLYHLMIRRIGHSFQESLTRIHFAVTIIAVLGFSRIFMPWEREMATTWLLALLGASIAIFGINVCQTLYWSEIRPNHK